MRLSECIIRQLNINRETERANIYVKLCQEILGDGYPWSLSPYVLVLAFVCSLLMFDGKWLR